MNIDIISWVTQFYASLLDFAIVYLIAHALIRKRLNITKAHLLLGFLFATLVTIGFHTLDIWPARILYHLFMLVLIKQIQRIGWEDLFLVYLLSSVIIFPLQGLILLVLSLLLTERLPLFLVAQTITAIATFIICKYWQLHHLFHAIRAQLILKLILAILSVFALSIMLVLTFENHFTYILAMAATIILTGVIFTPIFKQTYEKVKGIVSSDELKTDLWLTALDMIDEPDADKRYDVYAMLAKRYDQDVTTLLEDKYQLDAEKEKANIKKLEIQQFINKKIRQSDIDVDVSLVMTGVHPNLTFEHIIRWIDVLLDEALHVAKKHPVYLRLCALNDSFSLTVGHEAYEQNELSARMKQLIEEAKAVQASVSFDNYHMPARDTRYTEISIEIQKDGLKY